MTSHFIISENTGSKFFSFAKLSPHIEFLSGRWKKHTEWVTDIDYRSKMIIFRSILTTFESSIILYGSRVRINNWLEPKTKPLFVILAYPNLWNALYNTITYRIKNSRISGEISDNFCQIFFQFDLYMGH